jgi:hypothetical protein
LLNVIIALWLCDKSLVAAVRSSNYSNNSIEVYWCNVRKEQFKFKLEVLIKFCVVTINMVFNLKICTFICDDKLNCIQFEQTWQSIQFNSPLYMIHSWIPILQQDGQVNFHIHRTHVCCTHTHYLRHSKVPLLKKSYIVLRYLSLPW